MPLLLGVSLFLLPGHKILRL
uniref:Uncharacterized protein n=1 Tax=Arundo donax TaxID=35708 RepID=A0A0A9AE55_ARUDO